MQEKLTALTPALYDYLAAHNPPPDPVLRDLAAETAALGSISRMQIAVEQGALLTFLARLLGARRAVEIGAFTGYSAISLAAWLPDGRLLCCDLNDGWTAIARRYFARAGLAERITLRIAPAIEGAPAPRLRPGGVIGFDNVLWGGSVADPADRSDDTVASTAGAAF